MHELSERELYQALEYAKGIDEETGTKILIQFEAEQTVLYRTLFSIFPMVIAEQNREMANVFMDLCFDIICVYQHAFGDPPQLRDTQVWLDKQAALLDEELQPLLFDQMILKNRSAERNTEHASQRGLMKFMNEAIDDYASQCPSRVSATKLTQAMIFVVIRLFNNLYSHTAGH
ncbi:MAG: hypothetical protein ACU83N_10350 [Gammaproteobacteria bacterium]